MEEEMIVKEIELRKKADDIISAHDAYFNDLCFDAAKYLHSEDNAVAEFNKRKEIAGEIYDWLYNGCELDLTILDAESLAKEYDKYWR